MKSIFDEKFVKKLNAHLKNGGVIAFPTDTVWGFGVLPNRVGVNALFEIKQRPSDKHLIIMSDSLEHIQGYMIDYPAIAFDLAKKYWPGAITIGVPVADTDTMSFGAVRVPNYKPFQQLCSVVEGHCLATSSANISGQPVLNSADEIKKYFPDVLIVDNGDDKIIGTPSTVVILDGKNINVVRQGAIILA